MGIGMRYFALFDKRAQVSKLFVDGLIGGKNELAGKILNLFGEAAFIVNRSIHVKPVF